MLLVGADTRDGCTSYLGYGGTSLTSFALIIKVEKNVLSSTLGYKIMSYVAAQQAEGIPLKQEISKYAAAA